MKRRPTLRYRGRPNRRARKLIIAAVKPGKLIRTIAGQGGTGHQIRRSAMVWKYQCVSDGRAHMWASFSRRQDAERFASEMLAWAAENQAEPPQGKPGPTPLLLWDLAAQPA